MEHQHFHPTDDLFHVESDEVLQELYQGKHTDDIIWKKFQDRTGTGNRHIKNQAPTKTSLLRSLKHRAWEVRAEVITKLAQVSGQQAITPIIECLQHDTIAEVRTVAARTLGELGANKAEPELLSALDDFEEEVRTAAAQALGKLKSPLSPDAIAILKTNFLVEDEVTTRTAIIATLGKQQEYTPIDILGRGLKDVDWQVREAAAEAMGKQGYRANLAALEAVVNDESAFVSQAAISSLGKISRELTEMFTVEPMDRKDKLPPSSSSSFGGAAGTANTGFIIGIPTAHPPEEKSKSSNNDDFKKLTPADIENIHPIVAQAFDDQWVPTTLLATLLHGNISLGQAREYLAYLVRTEYIRSLLASEKLIINRVFLYNNPILYRDSLPGHPGRKAFKSLLEQGAIIPFLFSETSPVAIADWINVDQRGFRAWEQVCREVQTQCLRFSWDNEQNQQDAIARLGRRFHSFATNAYTLQIDKLIADLGLTPDVEDALVAQLMTLDEASSEYFKTHNRRPVVRTHLYERFITDGQATLRHYDGKKPFAGTIKQLLDLSYNGNLADALGGHLLTPIDSPTRLVLQELDSILREAKPITAEQLLNMVRKETFQKVQQHMQQTYLKSMGLLRLQDVLELRNTDEWLQYIAGLQALLSNPLRFAELADEVSTHYIALAQRMTRLIKERNLQVGGSFTAPWTPAAQVTIDIGGISLAVTWSHDGITSNIPTNKQEIEVLIARIQTRERGDAPCDIRLTFTDGKQNGLRARLDSSIEVLKGRMSDARKQGIEFMQLFAESLTFQKGPVQQLQSPTLNLPGDAAATQ